MSRRVHPSGRSIGLCPRRSPSVYHHATLEAPRVVRVVEEGFNHDGWVEPVCVEPYPAGGLDDPPPPTLSELAAMLGWVDEPVVSTGSRA